MNFKKIELNDASLITPFLSQANELTCELNFVNLLIWQPLYNNCYCIEDDTLFLKSYSDNVQTFSLPIGDVKSGMEKIIKFANEPYPLIWAQEGKRFRQFKELYGKYYDIIESRNEFDYIYTSENLINLSGKKYHSKRNHISTFSKRYDWHYEDIGPANIDLVKQCATTWYNQHSINIDDELKTEMLGVMLMLDNIESLAIKGGAIIIKNSVVAFTIGSAINQNIYNIHIEKALNEYDGAYAVINNEFASRNLKGYKYINREDDLGVEGLRKSKLSYKPEILLPKYICTKKETI